MKYLVMFFGLLLSVPYIPAAYAAESGVADCGVACGAYHSQPQAPKATTVPLAAICYKQATVDNVVLTVYLKDGTMHVYPPRRELSGCFNVGQQWLNPETVAYIELCNALNRARLQGGTLQILYEQKGMTSTEYACLNGKDCKNYRGPTP